MKLKITDDEVSAVIVEDEITDKWYIRLTAPTMKEAAEEMQHPMFVWYEMTAYGWRAVNNLRDGAAKEQELEQFFQGTK
jgi:hypothetical protein